MYDSSRPRYDTFGGRMGAGVRRASHVVSVLGRFGLSYLVHQLDPRHPRRPKPVDEAVAKLDMPVRLRLALEELGPTAIKLGQVLSTRADLVPEAYLRELSHLQDRVPPSPFEEVQQVITELCSIRAYTADELAVLLRRNKKWVFRSYLSSAPRRSS